MVQAQVANENDEWPQSFGLVILSFWSRIFEHIMCSFFLRCVSATLLDLIGVTGNPPYCSNS